MEEVTPFLFSLDQIFLDSQLSLVLELKLYLSSFHHVPGNSINDGDTLSLFLLKHMGVFRDWESCQLALTQAMLTCLVHYSKPSGLGSEIPGPSEKSVLGYFSLFGHFSHLFSFPLFPGKDKKNTTLMLVNTN